MTIFRILHTHVHRFTARKSQERTWSTGNDILIFHICHFLDINNIRHYRKLYFY